MPHLAEFGKQPGTGIQVIQVIAVDALDPQPVGRCRPGIAHADSRGKSSLRPQLSRPPKRNGSDSSRVRTVRAVASAVSYETYCFGGGVVSAGGVAGAAAGAAWPAASAGAAVPAAGGADVSEEAAGAGGGFAAWSGAADSCFAQAVSISAATIALRASLGSSIGTRGKQELCLRDDDRLRSFPRPFLGRGAQIL